MKKSIITIGLLAVISLTAFTVSYQNERNYTLTEGQATILFQAFQVAKKTLPTSSSISAAEASAALMSIDSIAKILLKQNQVFIQQDSLIERQKLNDMKDQADPGTITPKN